MRRDLIQRVFAATKSDFQPKRHITQAESCARIGGLRWRQAQPRQCFLKQALLARALGVAAAPAINPVGHTISQRGTISGHAQS